MRVFLHETGKSATVGFHLRRRRMYVPARPDGVRWSLREPDHRLDELRCVRRFVRSGRYLHYWRVFLPVRRDALWRSLRGPNHRPEELRQVWLHL